MRPAAASLSISGASEWSSFNSTISPWRSRNSGLSPTLTHSTPAGPNTVPTSVQPMPSSAGFSSTQPPMAALACIKRIVETGRHLAGRRPVGVEKHLARRRACERAAGMSAHAVGQHGRQRFDMRACAG